MSTTVSASKAQHARVRAELVRAIAELETHATNLRAQHRFTESRDVDKQTARSRAALRAFDAKPAARVTSHSKPTAARPVSNDEVRTHVASVIAILDQAQRDLTARGQHTEARDAELQAQELRGSLAMLSGTGKATPPSSARPSASPSTRPSARPSARPSVPAVDPRLERMNALVARATGNDRVVCKTIGNTQYAGVPAVYVPR
jgi:hypothetical protein